MESLLESIFHMVLEKKGAEIEARIIMTLGRLLGEGQKTQGYTTLQVTFSSTPSTFLLATTGRLQKRSGKNSIHPVS